MCTQFVQLSFTLFTCLKESLAKKDDSDTVPLVHLLAHTFVFFNNIKWRLHDEVKNVSSETPAVENNWSKSMSRSLLGVS